MTDFSATWTWIDGTWHDGNPAIMGPRTHAAWLGSSVFDGARAFEGVTPDLEAHLTRVNSSALALGLQPTMSVGKMIELTQEGVAKFPNGTALYIRPMYWAEDGGYMAVAPRADSTRFCLCIYDTPMPEMSGGFSTTFAAFRRPTLETMPTNAKAGCLYPNNARCLTAARDAGFDNAVVLDMLGNVAELATANLFMVKDGTVATPAPNGTFLAGITRARVIHLLEIAGYKVEEASLKPSDLMEADELFSTGNYSKIMPINRIEDRSLQPGPVGLKARELYWEFAHG